MQRTFYYFIEGVHSERDYGCILIFVSTEINSLNSIFPQLLEFLCIWKSCLDLLSWETKVNSMFSEE